jgi:acylphosphatase
MSSEIKIIRHVVVRGRVQGVGFRAFVEYEALRRGIEGWVRNRRDGTVEAVFAGAEKSVNEMIETCRHGPPPAHVDAIDQREGTAAELKARAPGELFSVLRTI